MFIEHNLRTFECMYTHHFDVIFALPHMPQRNGHLLLFPCNIHTDDATVAAAAAVRLFIIYLLTKLSVK